MKQLNLIKIFMMNFMIITKLEQGKIMKLLKMIHMIIKIYKFNLLLLLKKKNEHLENKLIRKNIKFHMKQQNKNITLFLNNNIH